MAGIDKLIINSAFREPNCHWRNDLNSQSFIREEGRRPAGYFVAGQGSNQYNDIGQFIELPLVNMIRPRVKAWREAGYPGVTGVTKKLLEHWNDPSVRTYQFFFCQLDAIETIIWLVEAPDADKVGINVPSDGGAFRRICTKLCTGGGKTAVMAMLIAWMVCNKVTYPQDKRFAKSVLIVAPGLTVKSRLQVLQTGGADNYYTQFNIVPVTLMDKLHQGKVLIINWQMLSWDSDEAIGQVIGLVQKYIEEDIIEIVPPLFTTDPLKKNLMYIMNMNKIVQHIWNAIRLENTEKITPVFDNNKRVRSTADMPTWFTTKPCTITQKSQISHCVYDSSWESTESYKFEKNPHVVSWAKNDHLGFEIVYSFDGVIRRYTPDFLIKLDNGKILILETKGQETRKDKAKRVALTEWVEAVNALQEYGEWCNDVSYNIADVEGIIQRYL